MLVKIRDLHAQVPAARMQHEVTVAVLIDICLDEMIAAEKARQAAKNAAGQWENSTANLNQTQPLQ